MYPGINYAPRYETMYPGMKLPTWVRKEVKLRPLLPDVPEAAADRRHASGLHQLDVQDRFGGQDPISGNQSHQGSMS
jgi:hypothetical protein